MEHQVYCVYYYWHMGKVTQCDTMYKDGTPGTLCILLLTYGEGHSMWHNVQRWNTRYTVYTTTDIWGRSLNVTQCTKMEHQVHCVYYYWHMGKVSQCDTMYKDGAPGTLCILILTYGVGQSMWHNVLRWNTRYTVYTTTDIWGRSINVTQCTKMEHQVHCVYYYWHMGKVSQCDTMYKDGTPGTLCILILTYGEGQSMWHNVLRWNTRYTVYTNTDIWGRSINVTQCTKMEHQVHCVY